MKNGFDVVVDVESLLNVPELTNTIDGKIWRQIRPSGSKKTDLVIGYLFGDNEQIQTAIVNIRIHVPSLSIKVDGVKTEYPNQDELNRLAKLVEKLVDYKSGLTFWTDVSEPGELFTNTDGTYFSRVQVEYHSFQDSFKRI